jgi:putative ABC transport system substrate-binding protein
MAVGWHIQEERMRAMKAARIAVVLCTAFTFILPISVVAQERVARIGLLRTNAPPDPFVEAFRDGMRALGYEDGRTVVYETRWAEGEPARLPALAAELAALNVDVILTGGETAIRAARKAAPATPIVMGRATTRLLRAWRRPWRGPAEW